MVSVIDYPSWLFYIQDKECGISSGIIHYMLQTLDSQHKIGVKKRTRMANCLCHCSERVPGHLALIFDVPKYFTL